LFCKNTEGSRDCIASSFVGFSVPLSNVST
jgi:hypothetical protein